MMASTFAKVDQDAYSEYLLNRSKAIITMQKLLTVETQRQYFVKEEFVYLIKGVEGQRDKIIPKTEELL